MWQKSGPSLILLVIAPTLLSAAVRGQGTLDAQHLGIEAEPAASRRQPGPSSQPETDRALAPASAPAMQLQLDSEADAAYRRCLQLLRDEDPEAARACLEQLRARSSHTQPGLRAGTVLGLFDQGLPPTPVDEPWVKPGRLELAGISGLFGVWNGVAVGVMLVAQFPDSPQWAKILGTGSLALGLGVGYGLGGYYLGERLDLTEGDARLVASGLVWGTNYGIPLAVIGYELFHPRTEAAQLQLQLGTVVAAGFAGGGAALLLSDHTDLDSSQVSMVNTGGWVGSFIGLLSLTVLGDWGIEDNTLLSLSYISFGTLWLAAGSLTSQQVELTWGETLICDLGAVLGAVLAGTVVFSLDAAGATDGLPDGLHAPMLSGSLALGTVAGLIGTTAGLGWWRSTQGKPLWRVAALGIEPRIGVPTFMIDRRGETVVLMPALAFGF